MSEQSRNHSPASHARQAAAIRGRVMPIELKRARRLPLPEELNVMIGNNQALRDRVLRRLRKYGNTVAELTAFIAAVTRGTCDLCGNTETRRQKGTTTPLSFDHDHSTGRYRGALCSGCNLMLGHGRDNPDQLRLGASYLERQR